MISGKFDLALPPSLTWTIRRRYLAGVSVSNPSSQACKSSQVQLDLLYLQSNIYVPSIPSIHPISISMGVRCEIVMESVNNPGSQATHRKTA